MKIQPISDVHLDCLRPVDQKGFFKKIINPEADLIILAGDMCEYDHMPHLVDELAFTNKPILYVVGNHEYYRSDVKKGMKSLLKDKFKDQPNVIILEDDLLVFDGVVFIGSTLWTDLHNPLDAEVAKNFMTDFRLIKNLTVNWWNDKFDVSSKYLGTMLKLPEYQKLKRVVITHHGPTFQTVPERFKDSESNCAFYSNLDRFLSENWSPDIWIHGHSHSACDTKVGNTRIIRNPFGYQAYGERDSGFDSKFLIEI